VPTTAGRKLDVSTGGEAGIDWANVGSPTTTVGLSNTTIKTATDVETDTADIQTTLGAAGAGLTALGDTRLANLDATVSSRSTLTQTQVSGGAYALNSASFLFDAAAKNAIADSILLRNVSNVEATAGEHTICTSVLAMLENSLVASPGNLVIYRTDGATVHATKPVTTDAAAEPLTGIS
jgi:hypothetical protein